MTKVRTKSEMVFLKKKNIFNAKRHTKVLQKVHYRPAFIWVLLWSTGFECVMAKLSDCAKAIGEVDELKGKSTEQVVTCLTSSSKW